MDTTKPSSEIYIDFSPDLIVYKDGRVEQLNGSVFVPPSLDPKTNVESKDTPYSLENNLTLRLYLPKNTHQDNNQKLPLLVYFHGGAFCIESAFSSIYHSFLNSLVSKANIIAASVEYRQAPENPVPFPHDDSWTALKWVASHSNGKGPDDWLNCHADFQRVFFSGDSAGANIAHHMGLRHGLDKLEGVDLNGIVLCHPYYWGEKPIAGETDDVNLREKLDKLRRFTCPAIKGFDDPLFNPAFEPNLGCLGSKRVLIFVAELDFLRARGWYFAEILKKIGWGGHVEVMEAKGEGHCFFLANPTSENSVAFLKKFVDFMNQQD
ncbi:hypothetical protein EZV62_000006 [Acer yangbiense]|uniref:Alpha/beta hydrolase fold-3 domain-containing protein n=1 Tax=Acer yangbiense TaxID=1000413 RepID=A0A5C7IPV3_9ROSI|nr:hypothetical protein EZV62_000006 [Acer yangbiense]